MIAMRSLVIALALSTMATLAQAADKQKLIVATEGAYPPYNFVAADGSLQGFDVDFAKALCQKINAECTIIKQDWDGMIPGLLAKKYDLIVASMGILPEREEKIDFSIPYYQSPTALIAAKSAGLKAGADGFVDPESLTGKTVGVQRATAYETFAHEKWPKVEVKVYDSSESADLDMTAGRLDARFDDYIVLKNGLLKSEQAADYERVGGVWAEKDFGSKGEGIGVRKGESELKEAVNKAILDMRADGTYKAINDKYFDFDIYGQ
ncbi:MAG: transporter substrate-binding domain-containing protein [Hyphomicrobiaceae bacterium]|mgnify:CR=1 FL=1